MTHDFDGLLPPRRPAPPLPRRDTPAQIVATARTRRRGKAARAVSAGGALSLAVAGFAALRPPPGTHGIVEAPQSSNLPSASASVHTLAPKPPRLGAVIVTASPSGTARPAAPGTSPWAGPSAVASPRPTPAPTPPKVVQPATWDGFTEVDRALVPDPGTDCGVLQSMDSPTTVVCYRLAAPEVIAAGTAADLVVEVCAQVQSQTISYPSHQEADISVGGNGQVFNARQRPDGRGAHEASIPAGTCARYTFRWQGWDNNGRYLKVGSYSVQGWLPGEWAGNTPSTSIQVVEPTRSE